SGQLALRGPLFGAALKGRANVTSGVLYFADLVQKRIVNLDELADTSLAAIIQQQRLGPEFQNVFLDSLRIDDLELEMGSDVWLRSNEANIQLTGSAHLTKQRNLYLVSGTLQAARGTYRLKLGPVTREFVVSQGTVKYFGTPDQDAALDIEARHVVHPVPTLAKTVLVLTAGFCEGRQVSVRNTPGLSLQFRISPEWRTEASFEPVQTCADPSTESQGGTVPRQVGLDLFWEKRY